ncbi:MAG: hypothetical protein JWL72_1133 [Ilumatobacteraceae bacterium]|nr:hypothetical protein [Ilumatobacteraceae bacterium]
MPDVGNGAITVVGTDGPMDSSRAVVGVGATGPALVHPASNPAIAVPAMTLLTCRTRDAGGFDGGVVVTL